MMKILDFFKKKAKGSGYELSKITENIIVKPISVEIDSCAANRLTSDIAKQKEEETKEFLEHLWELGKDDIFDTIIQAANSGQFYTVINFYGFMDRDYMLYVENKLENLGYTTFCGSYNSKNIEISWDNPIKQRNTEIEYYI